MTTSKHDHRQQAGGGLHVELGRVHRRRAPRRPRTRSRPWPDSGQRHPACDRAAQRLVRALEGGGDHRQHAGSPPAPRATPGQPSRRRLSSDSAHRAQPPLDRQGRAPSGRRQRRGCPLPPRAVLPSRGAHVASGARAQQTIGRIGRSSSHSSFAQANQWKADLTPFLSGPPYTDPGRGVSASTWKLDVTSPTVIDLPQWRPLPIRQACNGPCAIMAAWPRRTSRN